MALGWITLLKTVPWADVISTAPVVADGAKKLWKSVSKKPPLEEAEVAAHAAPASMHGHDQASQANQANQAALKMLSAQIAVLEQEAAASHEQMLESSKLISALAEQNAQLIARIEMQRRRVSWLCGGGILLAILGLANLGLLLAR